MAESTTIPSRLRTERLNTEGPFLDDLSASEMVSALLQSQAKAILALERAATPLEAAVSAAHAILIRPQSRLIYCGAGTSGRLALLDAVELGPTYNWPESRIEVLLAGGRSSLFQAQEGAEDDGEAARAALCRLTPGANDVVVGLAASGTTPFVLAALAEAQSSGALTIGFSNNADTPLLASVDFPILLETGEEALAGSTRLAAGTSQKIALNIFSTSLMVLLGKAYRGRMVDMRVTNQKLQMRAVTMVADLVGCGEAAAREALEATYQDIKRAVLVAHGASVIDADKALVENGGVLKKAVRQLFE